MMLRYSKAYKLKYLRLFHDMIDKVAEVKGRKLSDENICYLRDDFTLGENPIKGEDIIFDEVTLDWQQTCRMTLNFDPAAFLSSKKYVPILERNSVADTIFFAQAEQGDEKNKVPLTTSQSWFLKERNAANPHYWNNASIWEVHQALDPSLLMLATYNLQKMHDALHLRFHKGKSGWNQFIIADEEPIPVTWIDISALSEMEQRQAIEATSTILQTKLNISYGPLMQIAHFDLGSQKPGRLLWITHHLITDGVSNQILLEDFLTAYQQLLKGEDVHLPSISISFKDWAKQQEEYARSSVELRRELEDYWLKLPWDKAISLPIDYPEGKTLNTIASSRAIKKCLSTESTHFLLERIAELRHIIDKELQMPDVLLMALVKAFTEWTGSPLLHVGLVDHGRTKSDLFRTVGLIFHGKHLLLDLEDASTLEKALQAITRQIRRVPQRGIGPGLLLHASGDEQIIQKVRAIPTQEVDFNYHGIVNRSSAQSDFFRPAFEYIGSTQDQQELRARLLQCNAAIVDGELCIDWEYSESLYQYTTIEALAERCMVVLRRLIASSGSSNNLDQ